MNYDKIQRLKYEEYLKSLSLHNLVELLLTCPDKTEVLILKEMKRRGVKES